MKVACTLIIVMLSAVNLIACRGSSQETSGVQSQAGSADAAKPSVDHISRSTYAADTTDRGNGARELLVRATGFANANFLYLQTTLIANRPVITVRHRYDEYDIKTVTMSLSGPCQALAEGKQCTYVSAGGEAALTVLLNPGQTAILGVGLRWEGQNVIRDNIMFRTAGSAGEVFCTIVEAMGCF